MLKFIIIGLFLLTLRFSCLAQPAQPDFFGRADSYGTGCGTFGKLLVGDLNGDGIPDLACELPVLLGNGDGTFTGGQPIDLDGPGGLLDPYGDGALADLKGDGKLDIIVPSFFSSTDQIAVLVGNGDGTFQEPALNTSTVADNGPFAVGVADFNGDGIPDVVDLGISSGVVFFGRGNGSFNAGPGFAANSNQYNPLSLIVADVNNDGHSDVVALYGGNEVVVLLGNGDGTFQPPMDTALPFEKYSPAGALAAGDVNGDGIQDIAVTNNTYTAVLLGKGDGGFGSPKWVNLPNGSFDFGLDLADVNGDGILDLVNNKVEVAFGKGNGRFEPPIYWPVAPPFGSIAAVVAVDLRNDGRNDLITSDGTFMSVLLNTGRGAFRDGVRTAIPGGDVSCAATGDFNGDGVPDLVAVNASGIQIMLGTGNIIKPFEAGDAYPVTSPLCPVVGDLNGDGIPDLLVPSGPYGSAGSVIAYLGNGDGTFSKGSTSAVSNVQTFALGDFNGDGKLDYAATSNLLAYGNGDGSFGTPGSYIPSISPNTLGFYDIVVADLRGKSKPDIILDDAEENGQMLYVLYNEGTAGWKEEIPAINCGPTYNLSVNYVHGAREPDVAGSIEGGMSVLVSNAEGALSPDACLEVSTLDTGLPIVTDLNGDGIADAIWFGPGDAAVYLGTGNNQFESSPLFVGTGTSPAAAFTLNMHHQSATAGKPDLVEVDSSGVIYTLINETK